MRLSNDFVFTELTLSGGRYMVVDCGGGTVDITVHEISNEVKSCRLVIYFPVLQCKVGKGVKIAQTERTKIGNLP